MPSPDPFGRAIRDFHLGEQAEPLLQRDGGDVLEHPIERFYFDAFDAESEGGAWLDSWLDGPLVDLGAGVGRDALYFQDRVETVAIEASEHLVETMRERGVEDARCGDMFELRDAFDADRFRSALAQGTQVGLAGSMIGLRRFLDDLAYVTTDHATAVVDSYDPGHDAASDLLGFRDDPTPGLAFRVMHFEYEGDVGETLLFRLFSPGRLEEAAWDVGWEVEETRYGDGSNPSHYRAALRKAVDGVRRR